MRALRLIGRAATAQVIEVDELPESPYELTIELIDSLVEGEVVVASANRSRRSALWGELLSTGAMARGARGVVTDGLCRDTRRIDEMGFPVFAAGVSPLDSMGRLEVVALRVPVVVGGVSVVHGDLVLADDDGVVVIPASVEETVVRRAVGEGGEREGSPVPLARRCDAASHVRRAEAAVVRVRRRHHRRNAHRRHRGAPHAR